MIINIEKSYILDNSDLSIRRKFWQKLDLFLVSATYVTVYIIKSFLLFDWTWFWQSSCIGKKDFVTGCIFDPKSTMAEICGITTDTFQVILAIVGFEPKKHFVTKWILTRSEVDYGATPAWSLQVVRATPDSTRSTTGPLRVVRATLTIAWTKDGPGRAGFMNLQIGSIQFIVLGAKFFVVGKRVLHR